MIAGIGSGLFVLLVLVGACTVLLSAVTEQVAEEPIQEEPPAQEEPAPDEVPDPELDPEPEPAPEPPDSATILLSGDAAYSCTIGSVDGSRSVEGTPPQEYEVAVNTGPFDYERISVFCWKSGMSGTLGVQIVYDGQVRQEATTLAEYGTTSVSWTPQD